MLLIDERGYVRSLAPHRVPVPFVRDVFRHDVAAVRGLFQRCKIDLGFVQAMREELQRCLAWVPSAQPYPDAMLAAGMQAIADGLIGVASMLPDHVAVLFDDNWPSDWDGVGAVVFANLAIAEGFIAIVLETPENLAAFEAALAHPAGRRYWGAPPGMSAMGSASRAPEDAGSLPARAAALLELRHLGLVPRDLSRRVLRLIWMRHLVPTAIVSTAAAPPPQSPSPPPPPPPAQSAAAPASTLADPPDDVSPQAQTLIDAAQTGTPFCEECARRAAAAAAADG